MRRCREHALQAAQAEVENEAIGMPAVCAIKITTMRRREVYTSSSSAGHRQTERHRRQVGKRDVADMVFYFQSGQRVVFLIVAVRMEWSSASWVEGDGGGCRDGGERLVMVVVVRR